MLFDFTVWFITGVILVVVAGKRKRAARHISAETFPKLSEAALTRYQTLKEHEWLGLLGAGAIMMVMPFIINYLKPAGQAGKLALAMISALEVACFLAFTAAVIFATKEYLEANKVLQQAGLDPKEAKKRLCSCSCSTPESSA